MSALTTRFVQKRLGKSVILVNQYATLTQRRLKAVVLPIKSAPVDAQDGEARDDVRR